MKPVMRALLMSLFALGAAGEGRAAVLNLSQQPLFLTSGAAPNLFVTLDNSTSMQMAVVPDANNTDALRPTRRVKSATFNPLYYNPAITYLAPYTLDATGSVKTALSTSFTRAYVNGFRTGLGSVNLATDYRVSWSYNPNLTSTSVDVTRGSTYGQPTLMSDGASMLAENPSGDFTTSGTYTGTSRTYSSLTLLSILLGTGFTEVINGATVSISDPGLLQRILTGQWGNDCTASIANTSSVTYSGVTCTRNLSYGLLGVISSASYTITATTSTTATAGVAAYYYVYDNTLTTCTSASTSSDTCYRKVTVSAISGPNGADERQNFANWYSFYRSRALIAQTSTNLALIDASNTLRVGWQALGDSNTCILVTSGANCRGIASSSATTYDNRLRTFSGAHRAAFFAWLGDIYYNQSTPLLQAVARVGELLKVTGSESPYAYQVGTSETPTYGCRASYSLVVTDGIWNNALDTTGNADGSAASLPDGVSYSPAAPYQDSTANTLADLAFKYWASDAQTNLTNNLPAYSVTAANETYGGNTLTPYWNPRNDPATWQHLTGFYVGIGLRSSLISPAWGGDTFSGGYAAIAAGTLGWPTAGASNSVNQNNVYDLWHAAIDSRGAFFSAENASDLINSLGQVITRISTSVNASAGQAASPLLDSDYTSVYTYVPSFSSGDWSGDLIKYRRSASSTTKQWSAQQLLDATYASGNTAYTSRPIYMAGSSGLQSFTWANLTTTQQAYLNKTLAGTTDSYGSQRLLWLRGDRRYESAGTAPALRTRSHILGDIVNSTPVVVGAPSSPLALMDATVGNTSYTAFRTQWASRSTRIYVGANDGMLHAFDDQGNETFAFVPSVVLPNLYKLSDRSYANSAHQYYVDGTPVMGDVYFDDAWHTVLIGTLRGGGRSVFALDITDPSNVKLLWEKSAADTGYGALGYTYSRPVITRLHTGDWGVVLANGYNSDADSATLFIMKVADGSLIKALTPTDGNAAANGLASPLVADVDGDLIADYAYAGDLHGNLWRFDLIGTSLSATAAVGNLQVSFGGAPLYSAKASAYSSGTTNPPQPITASPVLIAHPTGTGYLVIFGTGKYLETSDAVADTSKAMTLYGIWDRQTDGTPVSSTPSLSVANLQVQTLGADAGITYTSLSGSSVSSTANVVSSNPITWYSSTTPTGKYGWYLNLPQTGEEVINKATLLSGTLLASSLVPTTDPCASGVTTYLYALDPYTGGSNYGTLNLGTSTIYSRLLLSGLIGGGTSLVFGNGVVGVSGAYTDSQVTSINNGQLLDATPPVNTSANRRVTWRVITNQN